MVENSSKWSDRNWFVSFIRKVNFRSLLTLLLFLKGYSPPKAYHFRTYTKTNDH